MAQWYHLFGLLSVMCMSFGALYIVFNSDYNEVCDYTGIVDSCDERKVYKDTDIAWENKQLSVDFLIEAQKLRNESEVKKCTIERDLLTELQIQERTEAERIVARCMADFKACVRAGYTTTTPLPQAVDCTACNRFCTTTNWDTLDKEYAELMGFTGPMTQCKAGSCPWLPECGNGQYIHEKCSLRGCPCTKVPCLTTTTTSTTTTISKTTTTSTTTTTTSTTTTIPTTTTTTTTVTTTTTTTTTTTSTTTTTTITTRTTTTSTSTTSTTTTSTTTTTTTTTTSRKSTTRMSTTSTTTNTPGCFCSAGSVGTVLVGRPHATFFKEQGVQYTYKTMEYWQGVAIETYERLPVGGMLTKGCRSVFSNRSLYVGPRQAMDKAKARANHMDLSCGYSGQFEITCTQNTTERAAGTCSLKVDISTCKPPTYSQALEACYTVPTTTTRPSGPTQAQVPDWLGVEDLNFSTAELPPHFEITTQTTTPYPCCEVHVSSVCRLDQNFQFPAPTKKGRWQPHLSYNRSAGYFPVVPCDRQAKDVPRKCPRVRIKITSQAYKQWPQCERVCNNSIAQANLTRICNRTEHPDMEEKEKKAHKDKIQTMKDGKGKLESWVKNKMATVTETKEVIDCFADRLPSRFNNLKLPPAAVRSGFDKMPLHNQCRLQQCKPSQCLEIKKKCNVPFVHVAPEVMCNVHRHTEERTCVDKVSIMSNNPMSLGFGIAWMVIGSIFLCAGIATFIRQYNQEPRSNPESETTALARRG